MSAKKLDKIDLMINELGEALKFKNEDDRIDVKASFIQLEILDEVKEIMKAKNLSRKDLAKKMGRTPSFVSQLFSGDKSLNLKMIAKLQEIFDAKFVASFKNYSEYLGTRNFSFGVYIRNNENKGWTPTTSYFDLAKYQKVKIEEENKAA
ncbi:MAG: helix-turn-helix domain-containing protein [Melioribacteraceae bacterium]|nr:helix-turn-helix domain-containing protein [Melioribacteraceae bacterium]